MLLITYKDLSYNNNPSHIGLSICAKNISIFLTEEHINHEIFPMKNGEDLWHFLRDHKDVKQVVILAPHIDSCFIERLIKHFSYIAFSITSHSNIGFLVTDPFAVKLVREEIELARVYPNFYVAGNSKKYVDYLNQTFDANALYLPNLYKLKERHSWPSVIGVRKTGPLRVGIFGATRLQKNFMSAAAAALLLHAKMGTESLEIFMNHSRFEHGTGEKIVKSIENLTANLGDVKVTNIGWVSWDEFKEWVAKMDILMQPSYTETFNIVTADGVSQGVPSVVSEAFDWTPKNWSANVDKPVEIADKALELFRNQYQERKKGYDALQKHNHDGLFYWNFFSKIDGCHKVESPVRPKDCFWKPLCSIIKKILY